MTTTLLLLALALGPLVVTARPFLGSLEDETQADLITAMNAALQGNGKAQGVVYPFSTNVELQGLFGSLFKTVGGALCKAGYDPRAVAEAMIAHSSNMDEAEVQGFKRFLKRAGSNLCDYITTDNGRSQPAIQGRTVPFTQGRQFPWPLQKSSNQVELQSFLSTFKKVGSALCRAASEPNVLAQHLQQLNEVEIEGFTDFLNRFGANLCEYVTDNDGGLTQQGWRGSYAAEESYDQAKIELSSAEMQGFFKAAKKVGSALCGAALDTGSPRAAVQSLGVTDEVEIQRFLNFLKRFGSNLCDSITSGSGKAGTPTSQQSSMPIIWTPNTRIHFDQQQETVKTEGIKTIAKNVGSALCRAALDRGNPTVVAQSLGLTDEVEIQKFTDFLKRFGTNLCDYFTSDGGQAGTPSEQVETQGIKSVAKNVGSALCRAALDRGNPTVVAQSLGLTDEVEVQKFTDFLKRFGTNLCDYFTTDGGQPGTPSEQVETQGIKTIAKNVGSALCRAALDGGNPTVVAQSLGLTDEVEVQKFTDFLKRFGTNLCDYFTSDGGQAGSPSEQVETQGIKTIAKNVGSALCRAALDGGNPTVVAQSLGLTDEVEVQKFTDFLKRFGTNLCDYFTTDGGQVGAPSEQVETQGIKTIAKNVGSALCRAALDGGSPTVIAQSLGLTDEVEIQKFTDFLKRFGTNLCDYFTSDGGQAGTPSEQVETQGIKTVAKNVGSALCRAALDRGNPTVVAQSLGLTDEVEIQKLTDFLKRFGTNLCDYFTQDSTSVGTHIQQRYMPVGGYTFPYNPSQVAIPVTHTQGLKDVAKKIGSALCRAGYDSPAAQAESLIQWDKLDQAEAQQFKDFLKRFGSNLCDYITQDGKVNAEATIENDLAQELMDIEE